MNERGIDTLIVTPGSAMRYLSGFSEEAFERLLCLVVSSDAEQPAFITPTLNYEQARVNPAGISDVRAWTDSEGWKPAFARLCEDFSLGSGHAAVDENMPARFLIPIQESLPRAVITSAGPIFVDLRSVKDGDEIAAMERAARLTDKAYHAALNVCRVGATEIDLAQVVADTIRQGGGELAFQTIIGSGPHSALPHHGASERRIRDGDIVLFDLGAKVEGYCGDITRVASMGAPNADAAAIYDIVYRAHTLAVKSVHPGASAESIDDAARRVIADAGYAEQFFHRTGHGIGLDDHEAPNIVHGNCVELRPGHCFSVEPGIYLAGKFGVRLENIVTVTQSGSRVLNEPIPPRLTDVAELRIKR